jgi:C_GCAxxG_C_C family probable redox protein
MERSAKIVGVGDASAAGAHEAVANEAVANEAVAKKAVAEQVAVERAAAVFGNGFHCAEAVTIAVLEALGKDSTEVVAQATAFGGGVGETFGGDCGALAGAMLVIGHLHGRRLPGEDWKLAAQLGAAVREGFVKTHETAHCAALRERFGEAQQMAECRKLVTSVSRELVALLDQAAASACYRIPRRAVT